MWLQWKKFKKYLLGRPFLLRTDHQALVTLLSQTKIQRSVTRVERWKEKVSCFDYTVEYIKGENNQMADWLSRSAEETIHHEVPLHEEYVINSLEDAKDTEVFREGGLSAVKQYGPRMKKLVDIIKNQRWNEEYEEEYKEYTRVKDALTVKGQHIFHGWCRFVPDEEARPKILEAAHKLHQGITRTCYRIREWFWWPAWTSQAKEYIAECRECNESDRPKKTVQTPSVPVELPEGPWEKIGIDLKGPISLGKWRYLLVVTDYYSKWPEIIGLNKISSEKIITELRKLFIKHGIPRTIVSDNGRQFVSKQTEAFLKRVGAKHWRVPLYTPQQHGMVERFNRVISDRLKEETKIH